MFVSGRVGVASDHFQPQGPAGPVEPSHGWSSPPGWPVLSQARSPSPTQSELSWGVQLAAFPRPRLGAVDVVQVGLGVGLRAVEGVRQDGLSVGPVFCCESHARMHIPVESDTAYRWHAPQTLCRPGVWECSTREPPTPQSRCSGVWLFPPGPRNTSTHASALLHWLSLTRSAGVRNVEVRHGG